MTLVRDEGPGGGDTLKNVQGVWLASLDKGNGNKFRRNRSVCTCVHVYTQVYGDREDPKENRLG